MTGIFDERKCRACGCTDDDCSGCIERTGEPCSWVAEDLCSACSSIVEKEVARRVYELLGIEGDGFWIPDDNGLVVMWLHPKPGEAPAPDDVDLMGYRARPELLDRVLEEEKPWIRISLLGQVTREQLAELVEPLRKASE